MSGLAGLAALAKVRSIASSIPRSVWIVLVVVALLLLGSCVHRRAVKKHYAEAYQAGATDTEKRIAKQALEIKRKADALSAKIAAELKDRNDEENRAIAGRADDLRLSGPGKAACPGHSRLPGSASGPVAAGGGTDAPRPEMPPGDRAAVPWGWLVSRAEQCDLNRAEVLSWREWWQRQNEAWRAIEHK